jgi:hypothetical protein
MAIEKLGAAKMENVRAFEKKHDLRLPNDYINFLLKYNGGIVEKDQNCQVLVKSLKGLIHVDVLYGIGTTHENANIDTWMDMFRDDMLGGAVIIGDSIEHGFLVLMCTGDDAGICYWDHSYEFTSSNDESNMYYITDTFTNFVKNLL